MTSPDLNELKMTFLLRHYTLSNSTEYNSKYTFKLCMAFDDDNLFVMLDLSTIVYIQILNQFYKNLQKILVFCCEMVINGC